RGQQVFLRPEESSAPALTTRQSTTVSEQLQMTHAFFQHSFLLRDDVFRVVGGDLVTVISEMS
ncbi:putative cGMP-dependent 3'-5'-cyclic phosphodiesterase, partial [Scophthalmus maximus]